MIGGVDQRDLGQARLRARDLALGQRGQRPVAREAHRHQLDGDLAEALAHVGVLARGRVGGDDVGVARRAVAHALRAQADRHTLVHERGQRRAPAAVQRADERVLVEAHVVEEDLVELGLARDLAQAADRHALGVHRHDEHRQALVLVLLGIGAGQQQAVGGELRVGRPHLLAVERPGAVVLLLGARLDAGEVRARGGLGEHLTPDLVAVEHRAEVARLLLVGAVGGDRGAQHAHADDVEDAGDLRARDLLVDDHLLDRSQPLAAELLGPGDAGQSGLGELALPLAPGGDDLVLVLQGALAPQDRCLRLVLLEPRPHLLAVGRLLRGVVEVHPVSLLVG